MFNNSDFYAKTVYRKDYVGQQLNSPTVPATFPREYPNPLSGPFSQYIAHPNYKHLLPKGVAYEPIEESMQRVLEDKPDMKEYFENDPIDMELIRQHYNGIHRSTYQYDICGADQMLRLNVKDAERAELAEGHIIPDTVYTAAFRNHFELQSPEFIALCMHHPGAPKDGLAVSAEVRKAMGPERGLSEYEGKIGTLADRILLEHMDDEDCRYRMSDVKIEARMKVLNIKRQDRGICWKKDIYADDD